MVSTVAWYEFLRIVRSRTFLVSLVAVPLALAAPALLVAGLSWFSTKSLSRDAGTALIAVDESGLLRAVRADRQRVGPPLPWPPIADVDGLVPLRPRTAAQVKFVGRTAANQLLADGAIESFVVVPADYMETGRVQMYLRKWQMHSVEGMARELQDLLTDGVAAASRLDAASLERLVTMPRVEAFQLGADGGYQPFSLLAQGLKLLVPLALTAIFFVAISSSYDAIALAVTREKRSKLVEILLTSTSADALLLGKVLGVLGAALVKIVVWGGVVAIIPLLMLSVVREHVHYAAPWHAILLSVPFAVGGVLLYGVLCAGFAFLVDREQGSRLPILILVLISGVPFFCFFNFATDADAALPRVLSVIPLFSPIGMPARLAFASAVPTVELIVSLLLLILGVYAAMKIGARLFRIAVAHQNDSLGPLRFLRAVWQGR